MTAQQNAESPGAPPAARNPDQVIGIQYLRAFAAMAVVFHHTIELIYLAVHHEIPKFMVLAGASGVDIFFVVSGFIMVNSSFPNGRAPLTPAQFFTRRMQRIYPLYWILALPVVVMIAFGLDTQQHHTVMSTIRSVLLLPSTTNVIWYSWTLKYEMYFYALFGLSLFSKNQFLTVAGTTIALIGLMFANAGIADPGLHAFLSNPIYYEFAFGLVLGVLYNTRPKLFTARKLLAAAALFSAVFIVNTPLHFPMDLLLGPIAPIRFWLWGIPAALIVAWGAGLPALRGRVGQMLLLLGNASYALYLSHFFVMKAFNKVLQYEAVRALPQIIVGPVVFVSCCLLAVGLHLLIEKPIARFFARLRKSAAARRPVQATPQVAA